ncbi:MAG TPA: hypothetical protein VF618_20645 [Thermoanaerobaculia bacterium]
MSLSRSVLVSGVRYRFATGLRAAMRLWSALLVALVIAIGLEAPPPLIPMARWWCAAALPLRAGALLLVAITVLPVVWQSMADVHIRFLPLTRRARFGIDAAAIALFLTPVYVVLLGCIALVGGPWRALEGAVYALGGAALLAVLGPIGRMGRVGPMGRMGPRHESHADAAVRWRPALHRFSYDFAWLVRMSRGKLATVNVIAILALGATELAVRNNDVTNPDAIARIASLFAACAALAIATEVVRSRAAARQYRSIEASLPISNHERLRAAVVATLIAAAPMLVVSAWLRPIALPYALAVLVALVLLGEVSREQLVLGSGAAFAVAGAVHAWLALAAAAALVPLFWRRAAR